MVVRLAPETKLGYFKRRVSAMELEIASFIPHYMELTANVDPRKGRFLKTDVNKGEKRHKKIINSRAIQAKRTATSGIFTGVMNPDSPWFKVESLNKDLMLKDSVRLWAHGVSEDMRAILKDSNIYSMAPIFFDELLTFGTAAMSHEDDFEGVARFYTHTAGSYLFGKDDKGRANTFVLKKMMMGRQLEQMFGRDKLSTSVKSALNTGNEDNWYPVVQFIEPNPDFREGALDSKFKKFRSVWYQPDGTEDKLLRESGFDDFPVYIVTWSITGEDIYGTNCPAMIALGDTISLQILEREKALAIKKANSPLLKGPSSLKNIRITNQANGMITYDSEGGEGLKAVYQIDPKIQEMRLEIDAIEKRIDQAFFVDLFLAISNMKGVQPRNEFELIQRVQESLLMLGPVLQRIQRDFLSMLLERLYKQMDRAGIILDAPPELEDAPLEVRFISNIAHAQRSQEATTLERFLSFVERVAATDESVIDKIDGDATVEMYGQMIGVVPQVINDEKTVADIREQRAQAMQRAQQLEEEQQAASANVQNASAAKQISEIEGA